MLQAEVAIGRLKRRSDPKSAMFYGRTSRLISELIGDVRKYAAKPGISDEAALKKGM